MFELDPDSDVLANLMAYKKVSNPRDLEGCKLLVTGDPIDSSTSTVLVPHNVSVTGQLRFKLYSLTEEIWVKSNIEDDDVADSVVSGLCYLLFLSPIPAGFGALIHSSSPLIGVLLIAPFLVMLFLPFIFLIYLVGISVAGVILQSDFMEL